VGVDCAAVGCCSIVLGVCGSSVPMVRWFLPPVCPGERLWECVYLGKKGLFGGNP
jgi:hypothetical protein